MYCWDESQVFLSLPYIEVKAQQYVLRQENLVKLWLNPGLNLTIILSRKRSLSLVVHHVELLFRFNRALLKTNKQTKKNASHA